jgi:hypothetical protein
MGFAEGNENTVGGCDETPEKEYHDQGGQCAVVSGLFLLTHKAIRFFVENSKIS